MKKIIVGSKNKVKIDTTLSAFQIMFPNEEFEVEGISTESNVSDQPMSDQETYLGAKNRANNASGRIPDADYYVGIESGLELSEDKLASFGWVYILGKTKEGKGRTGNFYLPNNVKELIEQGKDLGEADDIVFEKVASGQNEGAIGILTKGIIGRKSLYEPAVIFALIPFVNQDFY